jgi:hypothetical protein
MWFSFGDREDARMAIKNLRREIECRERLLRMSYKN